MKKHYFILFIYLIFVYGCKSELDKFNEEALNLARNDKRIDQKEFESLLEYIRVSDSKDFKTFRTEEGKIDTSKVKSYLVKIFKTSNPPITPPVIWPPDIPPATDRFNVNVFLENSESIDGYVGDNSSFKTTIFKLLSDLKNFPTTDSLNLNYINTKPIPIRVSASRDDINDFYQRLNPSDFRNAGGLRGSTDIEKMLKLFLDESNPRNLSVFISDCVFSPGRKDAKKYLDGQYAAIYNDFSAAKKANPGLSVIILQCTAKFEGTYFDYFDTPHPNVSMDRPYYIWFIGTSAQIESLIDNKMFDLIKNGYRNKLVIQAINDVSKAGFKILPRASSGTFDRTDLTKGIIEGARTSAENQNKGVFGFNVAVDFSKSLQDSNYYLDTANYKLSDKKYSLKVETIADKSNPATSGFTHILKLQTSNLIDEPIQIDVIGITPGWVFASTSPDDTKIESDSSEKEKTFGFRFLVEGVCDAFYPKSKSNIVSSINITIKK